MQPVEPAPAAELAEPSIEDLELCRRALNETREELRLARDRVAGFAAQVSHDLRTPLTAVLANAELLASEPLVAQSEDLTWMVAAIERGARRMNAMIEQMLAYGGVADAPSRTHVALGEVFEQAAGELAGVVAEKRAEVAIGPLPTVSADAEQMSSVAHALLSNALRFTRPGVSPRVHVRSELDSDRWRVRVTDNGTGVPPERREAMFVLFERADKRGEGDGVGLACARRVVEAHGGRIGMDGAPGGGTTVWFDLPA